MTFKIPCTVYLEPSGEIILPGDPNAVLGSSLDVEYNLQILPEGEFVEIAYYGEDDTFLDDDDLVKLFKTLVRLNELQDDLLSSF